MLKGLGYHPETLYPIGEYTDPGERKGLIPNHSGGWLSLYKPRSAFMGLGCYWTQGTRGRKRGGQTAGRRGIFCTRLILFLILERVPCP